MVCSVSYGTLCDPVDCSLPGSSVHGIFQARILPVGCRFLLQGNLPKPGIKPVSLVSPVLAGRFFITSTIDDLNCGLPVLECASVSAPGQLSHLGTWISFFWLWVLGRHMCQPGWRWFFLSEPDTHTAPSFFVCCCPETFHPIVGPLSHFFRVVPLWIP